MPPRSPPSAPRRACALAALAAALACNGSPATPKPSGVTDDGLVVQRWEAPVTWGPVWGDGPTLVEHAWFGAEADAIEEQKGISWSVVNGPLPPPRRLDALPAGPRWGSGPFAGDAAPRWQATGGDAALDLPGDLLVCAVVKPGWDPTFMDDGMEKAIVAKGVGFGIPPRDCATEPKRCGAGWVLMQMHSQFCFHYQSKDANGTYANMIFTPTYFADAGRPDTGPVNPSYVVVCGGRDGDRIVVAANDASTTLEFGPQALHGTPGAIVLDPVGVTGTTHAATIGGYDGAAGHQLDGRVYEVAVWNEPATLANVQAKMAAFQGLALNGTDATPVRYVRNREGAFLGPDGAGAALHTAWRHGPRIDPAKGLLFGLQAWNRLSHCISAVDGAPIACEDPSTTERYVVAPGEALERWTPAGGAAVDVAQAVEPPGDSEKATAALATLPPGGSLSAPLLPFDAAGPVHAQLWLRVPAPTTGTIRVTTAPALAPSDAAVVDLSTMPPGTWKRVWLKGLTTAGGAGSMTIEAPATNAGPVSFFAWGVDATQLGGGGDLGAFDPGPAMYDWSATIGLFGGTFRRSPEKAEDRPVHTVDVLELPPIPAAGSTAATGFCVAVEAQPADGLGWAAPFARSRGLAAWMGTTEAAQLYATGTGDPAGAGRLCFATVNADGVRDAACAPVPAAWSPGSRHVVTGCVSASGRLRVLGDDAELAAAQSRLAPVPDATAGRVLVGNLTGADSATWAWTGEPAPWHGWASKALACRDPGPGASTASCR